MPPENDPAIPANRLGRLGWAAKWLGLLLCAMLAAGFLWSTRRATGWTSAHLRFQVNLAIGTVNFGWRPDGWKLEDDKYPSTPGWSGVAEYGGNPGLLWWPSVSRVGKAWEGIEIPIWIPFLLVFAPTLFMWHRDRARTVSYAQRVMVWLRPRCRRRVTIRLVLLFTVLHVLSLTQGFWLNFQLGQFFFPGRPSRYGLVAERILTFTAPLWGWLYAWVWVRVRNGLLARNPGMTCASCGYDLTGNMSGVCPECGVAVAAAGQPSNTAERRGAGKQLDPPDVKKDVSAQSTELEGSRSVENPRARNRRRDILSAALTLGACLSILLGMISNGGPRVLLRQRGSSSLLEIAAARGKVSVLYVANLRHPNFDQFIDHFIAGRDFILNGGGEFYTAGRLWNAFPNAMFVLAGDLNWRLLGGLLLIFPTYRLADKGWRWITRPRFPPGHCESCGYNLRGNVSGICPECGVACRV